MASGTESEIEEIEHVAEERSVVDLTTAKGASRESAVWSYFEKAKKSDQAGTEYRVAHCKECGKTIKTSKGNTTNLMSHLKTKHCKIYKEVRLKTDERKRNSKSSSSSLAKKLASNSLLYLVWLQKKPS